MTRGKTCLPLDQKVRPVYPVVPVTVRLHDAAPRISDSLSCSAYIHDNLRAAESVKGVVGIGGDAFERDKDCLLVTVFKNPLTIGQLDVKSQ